MSGVGRCHEIATVYLSHPAYKLLGEVSSWMPSILSGFTNAFATWWSATGGLLEAWRLGSARLLASERLAFTRCAGADGSSASYC